MNTPAHEWLKEFERLTNTAVLPRKIAGASEWLKEHTTEHLYCDDVYGEPMYDLSHEKVIDFIQNLIDSRDAEITRLKEELEDMRLEAKNE